MDWLVQLDRNIFLFINSLHSPYLNQIMVFLSGQMIWVPIIVMFIFTGYKQFDKKKWGVFLIFLILIIVASDVSSSYLLKNIVQRLRPCRLDDIKVLINQFGQKCGGKYGFVSSHAANSIALVIFSLGTLINKKWFYLFWLMPILVGYSRIYLGVHYPGDILGGFIIGSFWSLFFLKVFKEFYGANRDISH